MRSHTDGENLGTIKGSGDVQMTNTWECIDDKWVLPWTEPECGGGANDKGGHKPSVGARMAPCATLPW